MSDTLPNPRDEDGSDEPDQPPDLHVELSIADDAKNPHAPDVRLDDLAAPLADHLGRAAAEAGCTRGWLSIVIVGDTQMAALHDQFMQIPETTDVLTFDLLENPRPAAAAPAEVEGELYICVDEAQRRAADLGHPLAHELLLYALHGLLHLLGYDDHTDHDWRRMHAAEDAILERLGVGRVFDADQGGDQG